MPGYCRCRKTSLSSLIAVIALVGQAPIALSQEGVLEEVTAALSAGALRDAGLRKLADPVIAVVELQHTF